MGKCKKRRFGRAFTVYELIITLFLFLLVAGLVISYISFMTSYSERNNQLSLRVTQVTDLRREVDYWFSYFDSDDYNIEIIENSQLLDPSLQEEEATGELIIARATKLSSAGIPTTQTYDLRLSLQINTEGTGDTFVQTLISNYPSNASHGDIYEIADEEGNVSSLRQERISCPNVYGVRVYQWSEGWQHTPSAENFEILRFEISRRVTNSLYACEIVYR